MSLPRTEGVSARELQVIRAYADGMDGGQVAKHLGLSINSIKSHLQRIRNRLGCHTTTEVVVRAIAEGWIKVTAESDKPSPHELWHKADDESRHLNGEQRDQFRAGRYRRLLIEHGHLTRASDLPRSLPCGWPHA